MAETGRKMILAVGRALPLLLLISAAVAVGAWLALERVGRTYQVHYSYLVSLSEREAGSDYRYDGYYAIQATDLFTQTLAEWITTPSMIKAAYVKAGLEDPQADAKSLTSSVAARKTAAQLIEVTITRSQKEEAHRLAEGLKETVAEQLQWLNDNGEAALTFKVLATESWQGEVGWAPRVVFSGVFLMTALLGINLVLLRASWITD